MEAPMLSFDDDFSAWLMLAARVLIAVVFLVSGLHKGLWYRKAASEYRNAGIPLIPLTLPGTIALHLLASSCLIIGFMTREAALSLAIFTAIATLKVHSYWRLPKEEQLGRSRITTANLAIIGGLLLLAAVGPGPLAVAI
jgi:putative oxidoreductase